jgi:hypothetical protein
MPVTFTGPVPPDHPMFSMGISFVFGSELPASTDDTPEELELPTEDPDPPGE